MCCVSRIRAAVLRGHFDGLCAVPGFSCGRYLDAQAKPSVGLLTHLAVASVRFDRWRAGAVALALLASTTTIAYWSLGIVAGLCRHARQLNPSALR